MATTKSTSRKSFKVAGPLRSIGVKTGGAGVRVSVNGQNVADVRNQASAGPGAGQQQQPTDDLSTIKLGRFIAEQSADQPADRSTDDENEDEREIVVGPITPIPTPAPTPIVSKPQQRARLGL